jgi:hypothetical protein
MAMLAMESKAADVPKLRIVLVTRSVGYTPQDTLVEGIEARGAEVLKVLQVDRQEWLPSMFAGVDAVFVTYDNISHAEHRRVEEAVGRCPGVAFRSISRKASYWPKDWRSPVVLEAAAKRHTVPDEKLEAFLAEFRQLWEHGKRPHDMWEILASYWTIGRLSNAKQLMDYMRGLVTGDRCPEDFRAWYAEQITAPRPAFQQMSAPVQASAPVSETRLKASLFDIALTHETKHTDAPAPVAAVVAAATPAPKPDPTDMTPSAARSVLRKATFEDFFYDFSYRWDKGERYPEIAAHMTKYFTDQVPRDGHQLSAIITNRAKSPADGAAPSWFKEWWNKDRVAHGPFMGPKPGRAAANDAVPAPPTSTPAVEERLRGSAQPFTNKTTGKTYWRARVTINNERNWVGPSFEDEREARLYADKESRLRAEKLPPELVNPNQSRRQEVARLASEIRWANPRKEAEPTPAPVRQVQSAAGAGIHEVAVAMDVMIDAGLFDLRRAWKMMLKFTER